MSEEPEPKTADSPVDAKQAASKPRKRRSFLGWLRLLFLWCVLLMLIALQAPVFPHVVHGVLKFQAWRQGVDLRIEKVEGSLFDPVVLRGSVWSFRSETGVAADIEVKRTRAWFAWSNVFPRPVSSWIRSGAARAGFFPIGGDGRWFQRLELAGVLGKLRLPDEAAARAADAASNPPQSSRGAVGWKMPGVVLVRDGEMVLEWAEGWIRASGARLELAHGERGAAVAQRVSWDFGGSGTTVTNVRGRTQFDGTEAVVSGLAFGPDLRVETLSVKVRDLAKSRMGFQIAAVAFGGAFGVSAETESRNRELRVSVRGKFDGIRVDALCEFLGRNNSGFGTVAGGEFSIADKRIQLSSLKLRQGENGLDLSGGMAFPKDGVPWWEREFDFKINGDFGNLRMLAECAGVERVAGSLFVRGAVSATGGSDGKPLAYGGQLILSGSGIAWRNAPLDVMNAALVFHEREIQVINAQFLHGDDLIRGFGIVSLAGNGAYKGFVRASVKELADYHGLLSPGVLPFAPAGGAVIEWKGNGEGGVRAGRFSVASEDFAVANGSHGAPIRVRLDGGYTGAQVRLEKAEVALGDMAFSAKIGVAPTGVTIEGIRIADGGRIAMEGDAVLPFDVWRRWPDMRIPGLLRAGSDVRIDVTANELRLRKVAMLTGVAWPIDGTLSGKVAAKGMLDALELSGDVSLQGARIPLNRKGQSVTAVDADFTLAGTGISLANAGGRHADGAFTLRGRLSLADPAMPVVEASGVGTNRGQPFSFSVTGPTAEPAWTTDGASPFGAVGEAGQSRR